MEYLVPFTDGIFHFDGGWMLAKDGSKVLLQSKQGSTIQISECLLDSIKNGNLSDGLKIKLIQHGFGRADGIDRLPFSREPVPSYFIIDLTEKCNYDCIYCFRKSENGHVQKKYQDNLEQVLEYIYNYCVKHQIYRIGIQAWGGEPLLASDKVIHISEYFNNRSICAAVEVETNASLISEKMARRLKHYGIRLGVSIDGPRYYQEMQRRTRNGISSYDQTLAGIENIKKIYGNSFGSISVITRYNIESPEILIEELWALGIRFAKFNIVRDNRYAREKNLVPQLDQIEDFYRRVFAKVCSFWESGKRFTESSVQTRLENLLLSKRSNCCESCGCTGGKAIFSFNRKGDIFPCEMTDFTEERVGNIQDQIDLQQLIQSYHSNIFGIERKAEICNECPWWFYCRGGCTSRVYYSGMTGIDEVACRVNQTLYPLIADLIVMKPELVDIMVRQI